MNIDYKKTYCKATIANFAKLIDLGYRPFMDGHEKAGWYVIDEDGEIVWFALFSEAYSCGYDGVRFTRKEPTIETYIGGE